MWGLTLNCYLEEDGHSKAQHKQLLRGVLAMLATMNHVAYQPKK
jgi:hypothetical protein